VSMIRYLLCFSFLSVVNIHAEEDPKRQPSRDEFRCDVETLNKIIKKDSDTILKLKMEELYLQKQTDSLSIESLEASNLAKVSKNDKEWKELYDKVTKNSLKQMSISSRFHALQICSDVAFGGKKVVATENAKDCTDIVNSGQRNRKSVVKTGEIVQKPTSEIPK
jgi:hypothetical protein